MAKAQFWQQQFLGSDGTPLGDARVRVYEAGTTEPATIWADAAQQQVVDGGTIQCDENGFAAFYGAGSYKLVVEDGDGAELYVWDDVQVQRCEPDSDAVDDLSTTEGKLARLATGTPRTAIVSAGVLSVGTGDSAIWFVNSNADPTMEKISVPDDTPGRVIILRFLHDCTVVPWTEGEDPAAKNLLLAGPFIANTGSVLVLERDSSGVGQWIEVSRSGNSDVVDEIATNGIPSAEPLVIPSSGSRFLVTGTTSFKTIDATDQHGRVLELLFGDSLTVEDGTGNIRLQGDMVAQADSTISLLCDGTNWYELSRATPNAPLIDTLANTASPTVPSRSRVLKLAGVNELTNVLGLIEGETVTLMMVVALSGDVDGTYGNVRKKLRHKANATTGYLELVSAQPFYMLEGDSITFVALKDSNQIVFLREVTRTERMDVSPLVEVGVTESLELWKPRMWVHNGTGSEVVITTIDKRPPGPHILTMAAGSGDIEFNEAGNINVHPGWPDGQSGGGSYVRLEKNYETYVFWSNPDCDGSDWSVNLDADFFGTPP